MKSCSGFLIRGIAQAVERYNRGQQTVRTPCQDGDGLARWDSKKIKITSLLLSSVGFCDMIVAFSCCLYMRRLEQLIILKTCHIQPSYTLQDMSFEDFTRQLMSIPAFAKLEELAHQAL